MGPHRMQHFLMFFFTIWSSLIISACSNTTLLEHDDLYGYFYDDREGMITGYDGAGVYPTFLDSLYASTVDHHQVCDENDPSYKYRSFIDEDDHEADDVDDFEKIVRLGVSTQVFNVDDFGAKADDQTDDSEAFKKAWNKACSRKGATAIVVPKNKKYLLKPLKFSGPCNSIISLRVQGTIEASTQISDYIKDASHWLVFQELNNFTVTGGGTINGNGEIWWKKSCKVDKSQPCTHAPTAMTFYQCNNLKVRNIHIKNAQQIHVSFQKCINVQARNLMVTAPGKSPNTDGIHVTATQDIRILNSVIGTGDDCISIVSGSKKVRAWNITCGPGHGISIGSLGAGKSEAHVSDVIVDGASLWRTTNGLRIKTYQGGYGNASNIIFKNIGMKNVENPIIVDQNYCDQSKPCQKAEAAVQVSNVLYDNIRGTSESDVAVKFDCSESHPCRNMILQNVYLVKQTGAAAKALCKNVKWTKVGNVSPLCPSN